MKEMNETMVEAAKRTLLKIYKRRENIHENKEIENPWMTENGRKQIGKRRRLIKKGDIA